MNILKFISHCKDEGSGAYNLSTGELNPAGFYVYLPETSESHELTTEALQKFYTENRDLVLVENYLLTVKYDGVWNLGVAVNFKDQYSADLFSKRFQNKTR
jgi:hypothetical protein